MSIQQLDNAKILIVEDEFLIADDLARSLKQAGAQPVGPASTADQARALLAKGPVDAAVLDLNLRGDMAVELVEELWKAKLPCVILSGYGRASLPESLSGVPSLEKPVNYDRVIAALALQLGRTGAPA